MSEMKTSFFPALISIFLIFVAISSGCSSSENQVKDGLVKVAKDYVSAQLRNPETRILQDSTIMVGDSTIRYFIQPSGIRTGLIDGDNSVDGIVPVTSMERTGRILSEHLIILNINDKLLMIKSIESDMKIISIKDRIISADVPTHPVNNPLHDCPVCTEVKKYHFSDGDLKEIQ